MHPGYLERLVHGVARSVRGRPHRIELLPRNCPDGGAGAHSGQDLRAALEGQPRLPGQRQSSSASASWCGSPSTSAGVVLAAPAVLPIPFLTLPAFIVAFGVPPDTLIVRSSPVPAPSPDIGESMWWPGGPGRRTGQSAPVPTGAGGAPGWVPSSPAGRGASAPRPRLDADVVSRLSPRGRFSESRRGPGRRASRGGRFGRRGRGGRGSFGVVSAYHIGFCASAASADNCDRQGYPPRGYPCQGHLLRCVFGWSRGSVFGCRGDGRSSRGASRGHVRRLEHFSCSTCYVGSRRLDIES